MAFIKVIFGGKKTNGGYLGIDDDVLNSVRDGEIFKVDEGMHTLNFRDKEHYCSVEGVITCELKENDLLSLTIMSGSNGEILDLPTYKISNLSDEELVNIDNSFIDEVSNDLSIIKDEIRTELILSLFLGWLGVHKFYKGKIFLGLIYMTTFGLLGIGWLIDTVSLVVKMLDINKTLK